MNLRQIEKVAKALGDATRLRIYGHIAAHSGVCCGRLVALRGVTPATISHHLRTLSEAGLIECRREGQFVRNQAKPEVLEEFAKSVRNLAAKRRT